MIRGLITSLFCFATLVGCAGGLSGNEGGSEPVNANEEIKYKQALTRCYKTGGTRIVKIMGKLRCY